MSKRAPKLVMESLAGRTNLITEYVRGKKDHISKLLNENWIIKSCAFKEGNIEKGYDDIVILDLIRAPESVYWPEK